MTDRVDDILGVIPCFEDQINKALRRSDDLRGRFFTCPRCGNKKVRARWRSAGDEVKVTCHGIDDRDSVYCFDSDVVPYRRRRRAFLPVEAVPHVVVGATAHDGTQDLRSVLMWTLRFESAMGRPA